jgi:purine nucleosidase
VNRRVHVDTDFGGDPDDACALAMLLGWPGVEITAVTTDLDVDGGRAGCVDYVLDLAGRSRVPTAAGAPVSMTTGAEYASTFGDARYWPEPVAAKPGSIDAALDLLEGSIDAGATIVALGALTNLARLERREPGRLANVPVVVMGGWIVPPTPGYPQWGPEMDFNIQCDTDAARIVLAVADVTLVTLPAAMKAQLRGSDLERLRAAGPVGALLATQSEAFRDDSDFGSLAVAHPALASDLVNFHWDPVAAAVAVDWSGASIQEMRLRAAMHDDVLRFEEHPDGRATRVLVDVDAEDFPERWLSTLERRVESREQVPTAPPAIWRRGRARPAG